MIRPALLALCAIGLLQRAVSAVEIEPPGKPIDYMRALREAEAKAGALADHVDDVPTSPSFAGMSAAYQQLAFERSFVGDYRGALEAADMAFGIHRRRNSEQADRGLDEARDILSQYVVDDALATIVREARDRQIVIINEAHHVARHRAFALQVARALRTLGFEYLAVETLLDDPDLQQRGYPVGISGYYTREPYFGDYVRQSIALGYQLVRYEQLVDEGTTPNPDWIADIEAREEAQTRNLIDRILKEHPKAKILIHVGYGHVVKGLTSMGNGRNVAWMAERLRHQTGIDPYCIDQANAVQQPPFTVRGLERLLRSEQGAQEVVLRDSTGAGGHWPNNPAVDLEVLHREDVYLNGHPIWMTHDAARSGHAIPRKLLPRQGRRLIQAFVEGESVDAVPMDQVVVTAGEKPPLLMLPPGKYRFAFQD